MPIRLVFADPHPLILAGLQYLVQGEDDLEVMACCRTGDETLEAVRQYHPDVVVLEFHLPCKDGWAILEELAHGAPPVRLVLLTAELEVDEALRACRLGVRGVLLKEMADRFLVPCIRKVHAGDRWLERHSISRAMDALLQREVGGRELASTLTPRECELVRWVGSGLPNREIAKQLSISEGTVKIHLHRIYKKLRVPSRLALLQYTYEHGLR
jgi:DNA-binding NarL/FixJ family response regulator